MAERTRLSIPAGQKTIHNVSWHPTPAGDDANGSADQVLPPRSISWSIVVLEDLTVDLEISAKLRPEVSTSTFKVEREARGTTFSGTFAPSKSRKLAATEGVSAPADGGRGASVDTIDVLVFSFSNSFSWFTPKEIELVTLREDPPMPSLPPPLESGCISVQMPPPRAQGQDIDAEEITAAGVAATPHITGRGEGNDAGGYENAAAFAGAVAGWLEEAGANAPASSDSAAVKELSTAAAALKSHCEKAPAPPAIPKRRPSAWSPNVPKQTTSVSSEACASFELDLEGDKPVCRHCKQARADHSHAGAPPADWLARGGSKGSSKASSNAGEVCNEFKLDLAGDKPVCRNCQRPRADHAKPSTPKTVNRRELPSLVGTGGPTSQSSPSGAAAAAEVCRRRSLSSEGDAAEEEAGALDAEDEALLRQLGRPGGPHPTDASSPPEHATAEYLAAEAAALEAAAECEEALAMASPGDTGALGEDEGGDSDDARRARARDKARKMGREL